MAWLGLFPNSYATAWKEKKDVSLVIRTHGRVAPDWDLSDALQTELQRRGCFVSKPQVYFLLGWMHKSSQDLINGGSCFQIKIGQSKDSTLT